MMKHLSLIFILCCLSHVSMAACQTGEIILSEHDIAEDDGATSAFCDHRKTADDFQRGELSRSMFTKFLNAKNKDPQIANAVQKATGKSIQGLIDNINSRPDSNDYAAIEVYNSASKDALKTIVQAYNKYYHFDSKPVPAPAQAKPVPAQPRSNTAQ